MRLQAGPSSTCHTNIRLHLHFHAASSSTMLGAPLAQQQLQQRQQTPQQRRWKLQQQRPQRGTLLIAAGIDPKYERSLVGENFGARDPTAGELASNFRSVLQLG